MKVSSLGFLIIQIWENFCRIFSEQISTLKLRFLLRLHSCRAGKGLIADGRVVIQCRRASAIQIGNHVKLLSRYMSNTVGLTTPVTLCCYGEGEIIIGQHCGISGAVLSSRNSIRLGQHVTVGGDVRIYDHDFHSLNPSVRKVPGLDRKSVNSLPIRIGDDVFIGAGVMILKGVQIGDRSIIGAGSIVTKGFYPADSIIAGNPAKVLKLKDASDQPL